MTLLNSRVCNFSLELPLGLNRTWANLITYLSWRIWITFLLSLMGHWVHSYSESLKISTFLLAFSRWGIRQTLMKIWRFQKIKLYLCIHLVCASNKKLMYINEIFSLPTKSITLIMLQASQYPHIIQMP